MSSSVTLQTSFSLPQISSNDYSTDTLLSVTMQELKRKGMSSKLWLDYLEKNIFKPIEEHIDAYIQTLLTKITQEEQKNGQEIFKMKNMLTTCVNFFRDKLPELNSRQVWTQLKHASLFVQLLRNINAIIGLQMQVIKNPQKNALNPVFSLLQHFLIEHLSEHQHQNNSRYFFLNDELTPTYDFLFWKEKDQWVMISRIETNKTSAEAINPEENRMLLITENHQLVESKAVNISFFLNGEDIDSKLATVNFLKNPTKANFENLTIDVFFTYYLGLPNENGDTNAVVLNASIRNKNIKDLRWRIASPSNVNAIYSSYFDIAKEYARHALDGLAEEAFQELLKGKIHSNYQLVFPTSCQEEEESYLEILKIAQENPEENLELIEWLAVERNLTFSKEELTEVEKQLGINSEEVEIKDEIPPAVIAQVMVNQMSRASAEQQNSNASSKAVGPSQEILETKLKEKNLRRRNFKKDLVKNNSNQKSRNKVDPHFIPLSQQLKPTEVNEVKQVLNEGLSLNKRRFNRLVFALIKARVKMENSTVNSNSQKGSHPKIHIKAIGTNSWGVTLSHTHGHDPNHGPLLSQQRKTILQILENR